MNVGDDSAGGFAAFTKALEADGWESRSDRLGSTPDSPAGRFTREDMVADVKTSPFTAAAQQYGANEMTIDLSQKDECRRVPRDSSFDAEMKQLVLKDYLQDR